MSYCVHCGVKIDESMKACPLCQTPVIDPLLVEDRSIKEEQRALNKVDDGLHDFTGLMNRTVSQHKGVFSGILSILFFAGLLVTLIVDISVNRRITWSFYTMTSIITAWFLIWFPLVNRGRSLIRILIIDLLFIGVFLLILDNMKDGISWSLFPGICILSLVMMLLVLSGSRKAPPSVSLSLITIDLAFFLWMMDLLTQKSWFLPLALPILLMTVGLVCILMMIILTKERKQRSEANAYLYGAISFIIVTIGFFGLNIILSLYTNYHPIISWAHFTLIFSFPLCIFCFTAYKNEKLRTSLKKKFLL